MQTFNLPLTLAGMEHQALAVLGADCELMFCRVEDVEEKMALPGAVDIDRNT